MMEEDVPPPTPAAVAALPTDDARVSRLARDGGPDVRAALAARRDLTPELLYFLAGDADPTVRRCVALNPSAPRRADLLLARDSDLEVRAELAGKVAPQASGLAAGEADPVRRMIYDALELLARDQIPRVRRIVAEALQDIVDAPREVVLRLAQDAEPSVAGPVLENSPVLTDDDLVALVRKGLESTCLGAVGRRRALGAEVCDAIAASRNVDAIAQLLANQSAQVREETLDRLIDQAPLVVAWHEPLSRRHRLPPGAVLKLATFVADSLLDTLLSRDDLDADTRQRVRAEVHRRLAAEGSGDAPKMLGTNDLTDSTLEHLVRAGQRSLAIDALALRAKLGRGVVEKILANRSAKGLVSLCHEAGLPMSIAVEVQRRLGRIAPGDVLSDRGDGTYPLSEDDMRWQLEFFADLVREGRR